MTSRPRPSLAPGFYPHIVEDILSYTDYDALLSARLVCSSMLLLADRTLCDDRLLIKKSRGSVVFVSSKGCLPSFHRTSPAEHQNAIMARTQSVTIGNEVAPSKRLNDLLGHLPPTCSVTIDHPYNGDSHFRLPALARLTISMDAACCCSGWATGRFRHAAREVSVHAPKRISFSTNPACNMIETIVNPRVERLLVSAHSLFALWMLCGRGLNSCYRNDALVVVAAPAREPMSSWWRERMTEDEFTDAWVKLLRVPRSQVVIRSPSVETIAIT